MVVVLQIFFVLLLIVVIILFAFKPKRTVKLLLPENHRELLEQYVRFYAALDDAERKQFEDRCEKFLAGVKITGANAQVEDLDLVLIAAGAVIPVFRIPDWEYINLREVLVYPGSFNHEFEQHGADRLIAGMVGTGPMQNVMILSKWELRQGFINSGTERNTTIHEFVHLVDKMDGTLDGLPEILLERKYVLRFKALLEQTMDAVRQGRSDIDHYAATSPVECFAVISEYFFEQPALFAERHGELNEMLERIYRRMPVG